MAGNGSLRAAKAARDDEFYTRYRDVEEQMEAYVGFDPDAFRDKAVLLPCDDPERSAFVRYFAGSFARLGLRRLCASSFAGGEPFVREGGGASSRSPCILCPIRICGRFLLRLAHRSFGGGLASGNEAVFWDGGRFGGVRRSGGGRVVLAPFREVLSERAVCGDGLAFTRAPCSIAPSRCGRSSLRRRGGRCLRVGLLRECLLSRCAFLFRSLLWRVRR